MAATLFPSPPLHRGNVCFPCEEGGSEGGGGGKATKWTLGRGGEARGSLKLALSPFIPSSGDSSSTTSTRSALVPPALSAFSFLPRPLCRLDRVEKGTLVQGEARFRTRKRKNARGMNAIFFPLFFEERR